MARKITKNDFEDTGARCDICQNDPKVKTSEKGKYLEIDLSGEITIICLKCIRLAIKKGENYWGH